MTVHPVVEVLMYCMELEVFTSQELALQGERVDHLIHVIKMLHVLLRDRLTDLLLSVRLGGIHPLHHFGIEDLFSALLWKDNALHFFYSYIMK